jgi:hypothetical protein
LDSEELDELEEATASIAFIGKALFWCVVFYSVLFAIIEGISHGLHFLAHLLSGVIHGHT